MSHADYIAESLKKRVIFLTGKGGVGKSTLAWALAEALQKKGRSVCLVSWNPFEDESRAEAHPKVPWERLTGESCFHEYAVKMLKFERLYRILFDNAVIRAFIEVAPGLSESVIAGKIWDLYSRHPETLYIVDLPASGHAVSFFQSPLGLHQIFSSGLVHRETKAIRDFFFSADTRIDFVTLAEELPVQEVTELKKKLESLGGLQLGYLLVNQALPTALKEPDNEIPVGAETLARRLSQWRATEDEGRARLSMLGLPMIEIPRFGEKTFSEIVSRAASLLEARP